MVHEEPIDGRSGGRSRSGGHSRRGNGSTGDRGGALRRLRRHAKDRRIVGEVEVLVKKTPGLCLVGQCRDDSFKLEDIKEEGKKGKMQVGRPDLKSIRLNRSMSKLSF